MTSTVYRLIFPPVRCNGLLPVCLFLLRANSFPIYDKRRHLYIFNILVSSSEYHYDFHITKTKDLVDAVEVNQNESDQTTDIIEKKSASKVKTFKVKTKQCAKKAQLYCQNCFFFLLHKFMLCFKRFSRTDWMVRHRNSKVYDTPIGLFFRKCNFPLAQGVRCSVG